MKVCSCSIVQTAGPPIPEMVIRRETEISPKVRKSGSLESRNKSQESKIEKDCDVGKDLCCEQFEFGADVSSYPEPLCRRHALRRLHYGPLSFYGGQERRMLQH